jgi:chitin disaccharide deacetylase
VPISYAIEKNREALPIPVILCADDYGLAPGVGTAIRELLGMGRLTATGCMPVSPFWPDEAAKLRDLSDRIDVGLHFTLTDQQALGTIPSLVPDRRLPGLRTLMRRAYLGGLERREIEDELERQIDAFSAHIGQPPAFLDGHQHVHQLPVVQDAVFAVYERRLRESGAWLRYCTEPLTGIAATGVALLRNTVIALIGQKFTRRGRRAGIPGNNGFRGVRNFAADEDFPAMMARFLKRPLPGTVIMCHPGIPDEALAAADPVTEPRREEYHYLKSDAFATLLEQAGIRLCRFREAGCV